MDKNIVGFIREDAKTVVVKFFPQRFAIQFNDSNVEVINVREMLEGIKSYIYLTTLNLKPGDLCMVWVNQLPAVVEVQEVHDSVMIEPNHDKQLKWIAARIDTKYYNELMEQNAELQKVLQESYQQNARRQFRAMFLSNVDDSVQKRISNIVTGIKES